MNQHEQPEQRSELDQQQLAERLQSFGARLTRLAHEQIQKKAEIETRWLEDLRQYHGKYDDETMSRLVNSDGSRLFVNITRNKSNAAEARLQDMLFPTDDRNWAIKPTPRPELDKYKAGQVIQGPNGEQIDAGMLADQIMDEATEKSEAMQAEIDDQLTESRYQIRARDIIHDSVQLGTAIFKGPVIVGRSKRKWVQDETGASVLDISEALEPSVDRVDPWDFFPDMSARTLEECEFILERRRMSKRQLREFSKLPGVLQDQLREVVRGGTEGTQVGQDRIDDVRAITGSVSSSGGSDSSQFEVWEYHGPIDKRELQDAFDGAGIEDELDELDDELEAIVFFSGNAVLKVVINPMDTDDRPYSVFNWEKDESSIFGFGVPYLMRNAQKVINASWRMMMDNAGASVSDIIVANREMIEPADGVWTATPSKKKLYFLKDKTKSVRDAFASFTIPNHQQELAAIFHLARQLADEETNLPLIAQGEQSQNVTKTSSGMSMLMNSANIVLRKAVKNWDDDITRPLITRFYDWNMQYSQKQEIKGDHTVDARGSGALLVKEKQQENLMIYANLSAQNPELAMRRDWAGMDKEIAKALEVPYYTITATDTEIEEKRKALAESQQQQGDPVKAAELQLKQQTAQAELQIKQQSMQIDAQLRQAELQQNRELKLADIAARERLTIGQLQARIQLDTMKDKTNREKAAGDMALKRTEATLKAENLQQGHDTYG